MDWTADGTSLLFGSDRTGSLGLWIVSVKGGKLNGAPRLLKSNIGSAFPLGCTLQNQFYFGYAGTAMTDVYTVEIDPTSGRVPAPPEVKIRYSEGHNFFPDYSPDGKYLAYAFLRRVQPRDVALRLYSLEDGGIRELDKGSCELNYPQWRPDGKAISWEGKDGDGKRGIYLMDVESEKISPLIQIDENEGILSHRWGIDGQVLFFTIGNPRTKESRIYRLDIKTGQKEKLQGSPDDAMDIDISPDGRTLVFLNRENKRSLRIIPVEGGDPQEIYHFEVASETVITPAWSTDGKSVFSTQKPIQPWSSGTCGCIPWKKNRLKR